MSCSQIVQLVYHSPDFKGFAHQHAHTFGATTFYCSFQLHLHFALFCNALGKIDFHAWWQQQLLSFAGSKFCTHTCQILWFS